MSESTKHREALERYFRLGRDRSLKKLHEALRAQGWRISLRTIESWSSKFGWPARIRESEREAREAEAQGRVEEIRRAQKHQVGLAHLLQQKGVEWLVAMEAKTVTPAVAIRAVVEGVKLEQSLRGEKGEVSEVKDVHEVHVIMGGPPDLFMYPDPDDPLAVPADRRASPRDRPSSSGPSRCRGFRARSRRPRRRAAGGDAATGPPACPR